MFSRSELYALMRMVEKAVEDNKRANRPLNECVENPAVNLVDLCSKVQDAYLEQIHVTV